MEETSGEILTAAGDFVRPDSLPCRSRDSLPDWQRIMQDAIRDAGRLRRRLGLPDDENAQTVRAEHRFPVFVPEPFLRRIRPGDPSDPLLRQVLPIADESIERSGFSCDPVGDQAARVAAGVLQKYAGRALAVTTGVCGIHCRYCFRREFDYSPQAGADDSPDTQERLIEYLQRNREIDEVILSGGDPLTLADAKLAKLVRAIDSVPHVARLRIHSRMPIVIPQRVTEELLATLHDARSAVWMVVHCNHPREIDREVTAALAALIDNGIPVLNQAVLLAGVNDDVEVLTELSRRLINCRVQPYYLHQLDRVRGAGHFEVPVQRGRELIEAMRSRLPGYAVPQYVTEVAGAESKMPN